MSGEYMESDRMEASFYMRALDIHKVIIPIAVGSRAYDTLLNVAKRVREEGLDKTKGRQDVAIASQVVRCIDQVNSLMTRHGNYDGEVFLGNDSSITSVAFCNILGRDGYAEILEKDFGMGSEYSGRVDFEKELVSCINGSKDSMLIKMTNDGVCPDDKFTRAENRSNLQNMYMDAKLLQACGREGDIFSLMSEVKEQHDVYNLKPGQEPKSQEEFDAEFEKKIPMYKEAAEKLRGDGKEVNISNLQICVSEMKREAEQRDNQEAKKEKATKEPFWKKWFRREEGGKAISGGNYSEQEVNSASTLTSERRAELRGTAPVGSPPYMEVGNVDPNTEIKIGKKISGILPLKKDNTKV